MEARAVTRYVRLSPHRGRLVADAIRGKDVSEALRIVSLSSTKGARLMRKTLESAIANAENNHDLDVDDLVVSEASVGKNLVMKRFHARARGRGAAIQKPFAQITIVVQEKREEAEETKSKAKGKRKAAPKKPAPKKEAA